MERVRKAGAISRPDARLRAWLKDTDEAIIGPPEPEVPGVTPWIYVLEGRARYMLHADVKREAVRRYLGLVDRYGDGLEWTIVTNQRGRKNAVAYGPDRERVTPFYLYFV